MDSRDQNENGVERVCAAMERRGYKRVGDKWVLPDENLPPYQSQEPLDNAISASTVFILLLVVIFLLITGGLT